MAQEKDSAGSLTKGSQGPSGSCWTAGGSGLTHDRAKGQLSTDGIGGRKGGGTYREDSVGSGLGQQADQVYSVTQTCKIIFAFTSYRIDDGYEVVRRMLLFRVFASENLIMLGFVPNVF